MFLNKGNILYHNLKQYIDAISCYEKALEIDPNDQDSKKNREDALNALEKERFANLIEKANSYYKRKNYSKVIELADKGIEIDRVIFLIYTKLIHYLDCQDIKKL